MIFSTGIYETEFRINIAGEREDSIPAPRKVTRSQIKILSTEIVILSQLKKSELNDN